MSEPKQYVPKSKAKSHRFSDGNEIIRLGFHAASLIDFIKANTNGAGYINLVVSPRRETDQYGNTHSVYLDTWKPKQQGGQPAPAKREPSKPASDEPPPTTEDDDVPF